VANGVLFVDNKLIYEAENLKVGGFTTWDELLLLEVE
jgi:hypothetical protein